MKKKIIQHLKVKGLTNKELAEHLGSSTDVIRVQLWRLQKDGLIEKGVKVGRQYVYQLVNVTNVTPNVTNVTPKKTITNPNTPPKKTHKGNNDRLRGIKVLLSGSTTRESGEPLRRVVLELIEDMEL